MPPQRWRHRGCRPLAQFLPGRRPPRVQVGRVGAMNWALATFGVSADLGLSMSETDAFMSSG